jgi:hypothetical protein
MINDQYPTLDQLYEPNAYLRKDKYYLPPLEPKTIPRRSQESKYNRLFFHSFY